MSRKIFLDCGGHCGCSRKKFLSEINCANEYEIFSFEPDKDLNAYCPDLINKAVWIDDCQRTFYKFWIDGGSSLSKVRADILEAGKPNYYPREEIIVDCFDIDKFIKDNFNPSDFIILKMDIEGAEYDVLPHMIKEGSIKYINHLWIEWHGHRLNIPHQQTVDLFYMIRSYGVNISEWDAMDVKYCPIFALPDRAERNRFGA